MDKKTYGVTLVKNWTESIDFWKNNNTPIELELEYKEVKYTVYLSYKRMFYYAEIVFSSSPTYIICRTLYVGKHSRLDIAAAKYNAEIAAVNFIRLANELFTTEKK